MQPQKRQKQPRWGVLWKRCFENIQQIYRKNPFRSAISIKLLCNFTEITLRHWFSPINFLLIFRTPLECCFWKGDYFKNKQVRKSVIYKQKCDAINKNVSRCLSNTNQTFIVKCLVMDTFDWGKLGVGVKLVLKLRIDFRYAWNYEYIYSKKKLLLWSFNI